MGISWVPPRAAAPGCRVLVPSPGRRYLICGLGDESYSVAAQVHFDTKQIRTVPHLTENCPFCPQRMYAVAYAPVAVLAVKIGWTGELPEKSLQAASGQPDSWQTRVLNITGSIFPISYENLTKRLFLLHRTREDRYSPLTYRFVSIPGLHMPKIEPFDVRPHLERMWGVTLANRDRQLHLFNGDDDSAAAGREVS